MRTIEPVADDRRTLLWCPVIGQPAVQEREVVEVTVPERRRPIRRQTVFWCTGCGTTLNQ